MKDKSILITVRRSDTHEKIANGGIGFTLESYKKDKESILEEVKKLITEDIKKLGYEN